MKRILLSTAIAVTGLITTVIPSLALENFSTQHSKGTYTLRIISLVCNETEDHGGADEPFLRVSGEKVWEGSMNNGMSRRVDVTRNFNGSQISIELFDEDAGTWYDEHDHLGTIQAKSSEANQGEQTKKFNSDGADYTIYYEVIRN